MPSQINTKVTLQQSEHCNIQPATPCTNHSYGGLSEGWNTTWNHALYWLEMDMEEKLGIIHQTTKDYYTRLSEQNKLTPKHAHFLSKQINLFRTWHAYCTCRTLPWTMVPMVPAQSLGARPLNRPDFPSILMMCLAKWNKCKSKNCMHFPEFLKMKLNIKWRLKLMSTDTKKKQSVPWWSYRMQKALEAGTPVDQTYFFLE